MASSQYGSLTPLQHFNQHPQHPHPPQPQPQPQQHPHYNPQLSHFQIPQQPPHLPPNTPHQNGSIHPQLQPQSTPDGAALQPQMQTMTPIPAPNLNLGANSNHNPSATTPTTDSPTQPDSERRKPGRPAKRRRGDKEAAETAPGPLPRQPTVHPFSKGPYNTMEDAIFSLQLHVFTSGYGVSQKRTVKEKLPSGKYDPEGDIIRKDFSCDRGGNEFVSQSRGERRRESKKCGCPWKAAIRRLRREGDRWFIEILEPQHNHPVTEPDEMHTMASYRRWQRENNAGIRSAIQRLTRAAAMPARQIAQYLKGDLQDPDLDRIDKQILRALSMNDKDLPGSEKDTTSVVFEMLARRPVIILQDNNNGESSTINGQSTTASSSNNPIPVPTYNGHPLTYHNQFSGTFVPTPNPNPIPTTNPPPSAPTGDVNNIGPISHQTEFTHQSE
ncbi:hypothetical protein GGR57DRAFT_291749 [Xylariaceae sp. FL1272]|nr:hypothetical protein GGR57DRAFT_291749 [Xylariaceae sp. FL1272]